VLSTGDKSIYSLHTLLGGLGHVLLGRNWLRKILEGNVSGVPVQPISTAQAELDTLLKEYQEVFIDGLVICMCYHEIKQRCIPKFFRPWPIPFALREPVEQELGYVGRLGTIRLELYQYEKYECTDNYYYYFL